MCGSEQEEEGPGGARGRKGHLDIYLYWCYPEIPTNFENDAKQLQAGIDYKKRVKTLMSFGNGSIQRQIVIQ